MPSAPLCEIPPICLYSNTILVKIKTNITKESNIRPYSMVILNELTQLVKLNMQSIHS